jgi:hypothetical protein
LAVSISCFNVKSVEPQPKNESSDSLRPEINATEKIILFENNTIFNLIISVKSGGDIDEVGRRVGDEASQLLFAKFLRYNQLNLLIPTDKYLTVRIWLEHENFLQENYYAYRSYSMGFYIKPMHLTDLRHISLRSEQSVFDGISLLAEQIYYATESQACPVCSEPLTNTPHAHVICRKMLSEIYFY